MTRAEIQSGVLSPGMTFNEKVWTLTSRIPRGRVVTYADIARALGTRAYRAVGNALNRNPYSPQVPCHRVVGADGSLTGFAHGIPAKKKMLEREGVRFISSSKVDMSLRATLER